MTKNQPLSRHKFMVLDKVSGCDYLRAFFAAWRAGYVVVPISSDSATPNIGLPIAKRTTPAAGGGWFKEVLSFEPTDALAQISMTSGTTGNPKAILLSHAALSDVTRRLIEVMALDSDIREYLGVPVTYSFGLGRARAIAVVGGQSYLPQHGFRTDEFAAMLQSGEVNSLAAVPTLIRALLAQRVLFENCGGMLRWLEIGSQYMSGSEKAQVRQLFPNARIVQHYGLTEASRTTFLRIDGAPEEALESVGAPTGDVLIKIDDDGLICIAGPHVAVGQLIDGEVVKLVDSEGWLHTKDCGVIKDNILFYQGRADDVLNVSGIKVSAEHFEQMLAQKMAVDGSRVAVSGGIDQLRGQNVMVVYLPDIDRLSLASAAQTVAADVGLGAADVTLIEVDQIPRTETGKVQRLRLTELYGTSTSDENPSSLSSLANGPDAWMSPREIEIASIWRETLGLESIRRNDSFFDIGGDSLSAITVALTAEQRGMPSDIMGHMFQGRTVAEIATALDGSGSISNRSAIALLGDTINAARGILVLLVIASHWMPFAFERIRGAGAVEKYAGLLFHMGTPGFAMIFGVGLSFFYMPAFDRSPDRMWAKIRVNTALLAGGVILIALLSALQLSLSNGFGAIWPEEIFFSVILSYFLILPTVPILLQVVRLSPTVSMNALIVAVAAALALLVFQKILPNDLTGFANLGRLMLITPYSYPQMIAATCIGIAIGNWLRTNAESPFLMQRCWQAGTLCVCGGVLLIFYTGGFWAHPREPHWFILYAGILLFLIVLLKHFVDVQRALFAVRPLILIGLLSFPAYIGHGMVTPIKNILNLVGVPYLVALGLALGLFTAAASYAVIHLARIYYPTSPHARDQ